MIISEKIFELIKSKGMSQKDFALATGISQSTISDWKTKKTNPAADKIMVICDVLGVTPEELLTSGEQFKSYDPGITYRMEIDSEKFALVETVKKMDDAQVRKVMAYVQKMNEKND